MSKSQKDKDKGNTYKFKVVFIGDHNVGKTAILDKCLDKDDLTNTPTLITNVEEETRLWSSTDMETHLMLYDTPGKESDESFKQNTMTHYKEADGVIICFDITNKESFQHIDDKWLPKIREHNQFCPIMILGNKMDLEDDRKIDKNEAKVIIIFFTWDIPNI